jgi:hypothetical protein
MFVRDLGQLAYDRMSTEGANERTPVGVGVAAPLAGALVAATGVLPPEAVAKQIEEKEAFNRGVETFKVLDYAPGEKEMREAVGTPVGGSSA